MTWSSLDLRWGRKSGELPPRPPGAASDAGGGGRRSLNPISNGHRDSIEMDPGIHETRMLGQAYAGTGVASGGRWVDCSRAEGGGWIVQVK